MLAWTGVTMLVAPVAGMLSDRVGGGPLMAAGLALQAIALGWMAAVATPTVPYSHLVAPFIIAGVGMGLFFAPVANVVLSAVGRRKKARRRAPTTRCARSAASSAWPCSPRSSRTGATTRYRLTSRGSPSWTASCLRSGSAAGVVAVGRGRLSLHPPHPPRVGRCGRLPLRRSPAWAAASRRPSSTSRVTEGGAVPATDA